MTTEVYGKLACKCAQCTHVWLSDTGDLPKICPNRECRSRRWNAEEVSTEPFKQSGVSAIVASSGKFDKTLLEATDEWPRPVAELEDTGEPYRASEKPKRITASEAKTLVGALCHHGLYRPLCKRCA